MALPLAAVVATADAVRATSARRDKIALVGSLLRSTPPEEAAATIGLLLGRIAQGRIGLGWRTVQAAREAALTNPPTPGDLAATDVDAGLTVADVDADLTATEVDAGLTVADVDAALTALAGLQGPGSAQARQAGLNALFARATATERDLLTRALLGDPRTGALDGLLTDALAAAIDRPAADVRRAVMLTGDLGRTAARAMADPESICAVELTVGVAVQPMLAASAPDVGQALALTGPASVEHKLDGARIQVHRRGDAISVHTRSLADVTSRVPDIVEIVATFPGGDLILDGETLMLTERGTPRPFQDTMSRFGSHVDPAIGGMLEPRFFDLLAVEGRDITGEPLRSRRARLLEIVGASRVIPGTETDIPDVAAQVLEVALSAGHEGVLVKALDSPYAAGRRGKAWVKVKPVHTLDLVVLAAEWGYGRRQGWLSNLHLGARDPHGRFGPVDGMVMVGKTFKGLTDDLLRWQTATFPEYAVRSTPGVEWLRPELVVEIAIDGVQRSSRYPGGVALRFARVRAYRHDKGAHQGDTIDDVRTLLKG